MPVQLTCQRCREFFMVPPSHVGHKRHCSKTCAAETKQIAKAAPTKICCGCKSALPLDDFAWRNKQKGTKHRECRDCVRKRNQNHYEQRSNHIKEQVRQWAKAHPEKAREYSRRKRQRHLLRERARALTHYHAHKEHYRTYRRVNKDKIRARQQEWVARNRDRVRSQRRQRWQLKSAEINLRRRERYAHNPFTRKAQGLRRAARKAQAPGSHTALQLAARIAFYGGKCWMCGIPYDHIDHVKPLAKGGSNWPANLRPACKSCNCSKQDRWPLP